METEYTSQVVGSAVVVYGQVKVDSADGVARVIQPNSSIKLNDRIDTGHDGSVTIIFNDAENSQLDLGRMSDMVIDQDVLAGEENLEISDVAIEPDTFLNLLEEWNLFEPTASVETLTSNKADMTGAEDTVDSDVLMRGSAPIETGKAVEDLTSAYAGDDGISSLDDDLDLTNLVPPPEDAT